MINIAKEYRDKNNLSWPSPQFETPLLDELERGAWPSFVKCAPPEDHDQGESGTGDSGE